MATNHTATGTTYSNLTRRELEQLRKADFFAGGKALTVGDGSNSGSINDEQYYTSATVYSGDVWAVRPPSVPVPFLLSSTQPSNFVAESVRWYGPKFITSGDSGYGMASLTWADASVDADFSSVLAGDILLVKSPDPTATDLNGSATGVISSVSNTGGVLPSQTLVLSKVVAPKRVPHDALEVSSTNYPYAIVRQDAVQLFAVPGSGSVLGREQTFLAVRPDSLLHGLSAPTVDAINADRITDLVPPSFAAGTTVDRADAIYQPPGGPGSSLDLVGYRPILYRSLPDGSGPDFSAPIPSNPRIDDSVPDNDQRFTIDYKAGVFRFSTMPAAGNDVKPSGGTQGTHPTTQRLQLWAVFWAVDKSLTEGASSSIYVSRSTENKYRSPGRAYLEDPLYGDISQKVFRIGATSEGNDFIVRALDAEESGLGSEFDPYRKTDFGVLNRSLSDTGNDPFRGFRIRDDGKIRMVQTATQGNPIIPEVRIEDKKQLAVGTVARPGGDQNIRYHAGTAGISGIRRSKDDIQEVLYDSLLQGEYPSVRLRRSVYRLNGDVFVPPGVTLEGDGYGTIIEENQGSIKIGPNTVWGTFDPTASSDGRSVVPTIFELPESFYVVGYDIVWNKARSVWGVFVADGNTNAIWFNELRLDGSKVFDGLGINVKESSTKFFTPASSNSQVLTHGHYPRAEHEPHTDSYVFCWTEEYSGGSGVGPKSYFATLSYTEDPSLTLVGRYVASSPVAVVTTPGAYSMHPSLAVAPSEVSGSNYYICATAFSKQDLDWSASLSYLKTTIFQSTGAFVTDYTESATGVVYSSTDCTWVGTATGSAVPKFLAAYSVRNHPVVYRTSGSFDALGRFTEPGLSSWAPYGIQAGDRFLLTAQTSNSTLINGRTGTVRSVSGAYLDIKFEGAEGADAEVMSPVSDLNYVIFPACRVFSKAFTTAEDSPATLIAGPAETLDTLTYYVQEREPDFVRLSTNGRDRVILVYQNFDTRASASRYSIKNFDNGKDSGYDIDFAGLRGKSPYPVRVHLSTSYAILSYTALWLGGVSGNVLAVQAPSLTTGGSSQETYDLPNLRRSNDVEVIRRSLGSRDPLDVYPNAVWNTYHHYDEVALRNYSLEIRDGFVPSLIPDVAWGGVDWTIVSPTVDRIQSNTGELTYTGDVQYLSDPTFLFSDDSEDLVQGRSYRKTIGSGDEIYFPGILLGVSRTITSVVSEHVVALDSAVVPGGLNGGNQEWRLVRSGTGNRDDQGLIKTPGFRVGSDGRVIVTSSYVTFADEVSPLSQEKPKQEILERRLFGNTVFNRLTAKVVATTLVTTFGTGVHTIDGQVIQPGDRVLLTHSSNAGLYIARDDNWVPAPEFVIDYNHVGGIDVYVTHGSTFAGTTWECTNTDPNDVFGVDTLTFNNKGTGNIDAYADSRYGQPGITWNDLVEGSRLEGDIGFKGVAVGMPRFSSSGRINPSELSTVAIAWGDNLFGFLDRERIDGESVKVRAFRQSFGPYNSSVKNLTVRSMSGAGDMEVSYRNHVYTRHGGSGCPNPFFATDGYRNVFLHIGVWSMGQSWEDGVLSKPVFTGRDPRVAEAYNMSLCAVFTDISGKYTLRKRVFTFPHVSRLQPSIVYGGDSEAYKKGLPEWQRNYLIGTLPQDLIENAYPSQKRKPSYGARAIWTGKTFLGLLVIPRGLLLFDLGASEEDSILDDAVVGGTVVQDASTYKLYELPKIKAFAYVGNGNGSPPGPNTYIERYLNEAKGDTRSLEIVDLVQVDTCYADGVLAVVWLAGLNVSNPSYLDDAQMMAEMGCPVLGVTLFQNGQGAGALTASRGTNSAFFNATTYVIDTAPYKADDGSRLGNGTIRDPKIVWNGDGFTVTYIYKSEDTGISTAYDLKSFSFPKEGLRSNFQIVTAQGPADRESELSNWEDLRLGSVTSTGKLSLASLRDSYVVKPGDIVVITRTSGAIERPGDYPSDSVQNNASVGFFNLAGAYTVTSYDSYAKVAQFGVNLLKPGVEAGDSVFGMILSGDGVSPGRTDDRSTNLVTSGTSSRGRIVRSPYRVPVAEPPLTDLWALFYVPKQDRFVAFYSRGAHCYARAFTKNGDAIGETKIYFNEAEDESVRHYSVGWNGEHFLLVSSHNNTLVTSVYTLLTADLGIVSRGTLVGPRTDLVGNTRSLVPGPGYGTPDGDYIPAYQLRASSVVWNPKLCKWQVAISLGWWGNQTNRVKYGGLSFGSSIGVLGYSNRKITRSSFPETTGQPGLRLLWAEYIQLNSSTYSGTLTNATPPMLGQHSLFVGPLLDTSRIGVLFVGCDAVTTSIEVTVPPVIRDAANFYLKIENEIVFVTAVDVQGSKVVCTVNRGVKGTTPAPHTGGTSVYYHAYLTGNQGYLGGSTFVSESIDFHPVSAGDLITFPTPEPEPTANEVVIAHLAKDSIRETWLGYGANDYAFIDGAIHPLTFADKASYPGTVGFKVERVNKKYLFHTIKVTGVDCDVSTHSGEIYGLPYPGSIGNSKCFVLQREDIFLLTLGDPHPMIEVKDADGVVIENVQFQGGCSDVSESYPRMSRPFWKTGGVTFGMLGSSLATSKLGQKPHVAPVTPTPLGKVEILQFTNVRSTAQAKYDSSKKGI